MTTFKQLQDRLAAAAAEMSRNDERMAFQQEQLSKMRDIADERDVALADVAYLRARAEAAEGNNAALREREADLVHTLHMEQDAHDRCREELAAREWRNPNDQLESGPVQIILDAQMNDFFFYVPDENGRMVFKNSIVAWRPRPAPEDDDR